VQSIKPTQSGGRRIEFDTPFGQGHAEWDADGRLVSESLEIRSPVPQRSRGLGDTIAKGTKLIGIKPCGGCDRRRRLLNFIVPYKR
jgi:hypothetical protein